VIEPEFRPPTREIGREVDTSAGREAGHRAPPEGRATVWWRGLPGAAAGAPPAL